MLEEDFGGAALIGSQLAVKATTLSIASKLDTALASGNQGDMRVELTALYNFFGELKALHQDLSAAAKSAAPSGSAGADDATLQLVQSLQDVLGATIPGVESAMTAATKLATSTSEGMTATFKGLANLVAQNMIAVHDTYLAYLNADKAGASALSAAANKQIRGDWNGVNQAASVVTSGAAGRDFVI